MVAGSREPLPSAAFSGSRRFPNEARSAMFGFLNAWRRLVQQDQTSARAHFSASGDAVGGRLAYEGCSPSAGGVFRASMRK